VLEGYVRRYPDQWLWLHDRWKSARKRLSGTL
jgi:KDO2-lipid IV(A) lauroyltransferase